MTYDEWKLETPQDEHHRIYGAPKRGKYSVTVTRTITAILEVEVEASNESDACFDAEIAAKAIALDKWVIDEDGCDCEVNEGPPERDPDDARDEKMDRDLYADRDMTNYD